MLGGLDSRDFCMDPKLEGLVRGQRMTVHSMLVVAISSMAVLPVSAGHLTCICVYVHLANTFRQQYEHSIHLETPRASKLKSNTAASTIRIGLGGIF